MNIPSTAIDCGEASRLVLSWMGDALLFGSLLAGATWLLLRISGRRIPHAIETLLWSAVLFKFLFPVGTAFSFSTFRVHDDLHVVRDLPTEHNAGFEPLIPEIKEHPRHAAPVMIIERNFLNWPTLVVLCHLACAAALILRRARRHHRFLVRCRALPRADGWTQDMAAQVCRRLGVRRVPSVRNGGEATSSFVTGCFRPILVIAHRHLVRPDEVETVILHEVAHLRRGDMLVRYLQWIAGSIFFFWPVVAWVNRRIDLAREYACDEWALRRGKLAAGEYARCLLNAMQPARGAHLACHPTGLASNRRCMERRIDMILQFPSRPSKRARWNLFTWALMLLWGGFALAGSTGERKGDWPATEEAVKERAALLYNLVAAIKEADVNADGVLTYLEKDSYLVALAMSRPGAFMEEFPFADRNQSEMLDYLEVYGVIRGITLIAYADRRPSAPGSRRLDMEFYHMALGAQEWLLDNVPVKPSAGELDNIWSVLKRTQGRPSADHNRMLDHGAPEAAVHSCKDAHDVTERFKELKGNVKRIGAKLAAERNPKRAAKLRAMLNKLEEILYKLEGE